MNRPIDLAHMQAGFAEPVQDAQRCFRAVLEAFSRPGRIQQMSDLAAPPPGLGAAQAAVLLALLDTDTPLWLPPALRDAAAGHWLRFHCGCPLATDLTKAQFVVLGALDELPPLDSLYLGEADYPDRSATLLIEVDTLASNGPLRLVGPGIEREHRLQVAGWNESVSRFAHENRRSFPLGVDMLLCCGERLAGLPRTTQIKEDC